MKLYDRYYKCDTSEIDSRLLKLMTDESAFDVIFSK